MDINPASSLEPPSLPGARPPLWGWCSQPLLAFAIPKRYTTSTRLMPPDPQSTSSMMMLAGMAEKAGNGLGSMAGDLLGLKSSGALFVGMLQSQTIEDHLVQQFDLKKVYRAKLLDDARKELAQNTAIQEDRKSGIITITVTDHSRAEGCRDCKRLRQRTEYDGRPAIDLFRPSRARVPGRSSSIRKKRS